MEYKSSNDAVARLGYLALGTRLKRLGDQLQAGVAEAIARLGGAVQPAQMVMLVAIDAGDGLTVADLVEAIGVSQPAISRSLGSLQKAGLVNLTADENDGRVRRARLTHKGRQVLADIHQQLFPKVAAAAEQLCEGLDLLDRLGIAEGRLRERTFGRRIEEARA